MGDVLLDGLNQGRHALEYPPSESLARQFPKETFHQIQPRTARGREMHVKAGMAFQPLLHLEMFVCRIIVHDKMEGLVLGRLPINEPQEL